MIRRFLSLNLRTKLIALIIVTAFIPVSLLGLFSYNYVTKLMQEEISEGELERLKQVNNNLTYFINDVEQLSLFLYKNEEIQEILNKDPYRSPEEKDEDLQQIERLFETVMGAKNWDVSIYIIGANGDRYFSTQHLPPHYNHIRDNWGAFRKAQAADGKNIWDTHYSIRPEEMQEVVLTSGRMLHDHSTQEPLGYLMIDIYESALSDIYATGGKHLNDQLFLLDEQGYIISSQPNKEIVGTRLSYDFLPRVIQGDQGFFEAEWESQASVLTYDTAEDTGFKIVSLTPIGLIHEKNSLIRNLTWSFAILGIIISSWLAYFLSKTVTDPLYKVMKVMRTVEKGDLTARFAPKYNDDIGIFARRFNRMLGRVNKLIQENYEKKIRLKESEIKALQAQINPHFLYNTLETVNWMARLHGAKEISKLVVSLGEIMRYSIKRGDDLVPLEEDIKQLKNYLNIQEVRYRDQFNIHMHVDEEAKKALIPSLLLQPLVENAISHGLEGKVEKGNLSITITVISNSLQIIVEDDGAGIDSKTLDRINLEKPLQSKGTGIGLQNVKRRVFLYYGNDFTWHIETKENEGTKFSITLPAYREESA
ncbi:cache domain-containing sensor histidine kinase [Alteribacter keqinensis]|nr:sensor histidine kinase [Alteribacter keqinensis]